MKVLIQPQRYTAKAGWQPCEPHQAQAWAAIIGARLVGRYGNKALATEAAASALLRGAGPKRRYQLGGRLEPHSADVGIYAASLTRAEYDKLNGA